MKAWQMAVLMVLVVLLAACEREVEAPWAAVHPPEDRADVWESEGRLFVVFAPEDAEVPHVHMGFPPFSDSDPFFAVDVEDWNGDEPLRLAGDMIGFPPEQVDDVPEGRYQLQAIYKTDFFFHQAVSEGSWLSEPLVVDWPADRGEIELQLSEYLPDELPADRSNLQFVRIKSELLSEFWGEEIELRAAVILPTDWEESGDEYPVRYNIGGYGSRYTRALELMEAGSDFRDDWYDPANPKFIMVLLDGTGPFGDPYQINSRNSGPWGDAVTEELIPYIEERFRAIGEPEARFLDGGSTGGWASLAMQVFYPDYFNGAWSFCADSPDFRRFQLINLYEDENAYYNRHNYLIPSKRSIEGDPEFSIKAEIAMERVMGRGDSFVTGGEQWGAWHALYGPRGDDGLPVPAWDEHSGEIDPAVVEYWKDYDLVRYLEANWDEIGEELAGKLNIWMGDMDDYYLNPGMYRLADLMDELSNPDPEARFTWGRLQGHCWIPLSHAEIFSEMAERLED
ncbi:alpha/beta hydrolase-fold protein [Gammaproteobacteria bacterium AB-CW1]|uniref:Alpha/beta hydrolase-fold protein n=1 Tax=Natronospira elongata TaxID=3110268 RepID=A0AAP6MKB3_9GAMM|nr:alpha/beta hydrolase-fold protein [Gammaproteobacteria bacterium AB-CW1]